jgi:hypothetical protein
MFCSLPSFVMLTICCPGRQRAVTIAYEKLKRQENDVKLDTREALERLVSYVNELFGHKESITVTGCEELMLGKQRRLSQKQRKNSSKK